MNVPTVEELVSELRAVSGSQTVEPGTALQTASDVDSLDLMEWLYALQNAHPDLALDETLFEGMDETTTVQDIHGLIVARVQVPAGQA